MKRISQYLSLTIFLAALVASPLHATDGIADRVVVKKAERKLYLMSGESVVQAYDIALGLVPQGGKQREGDFKTPEGDYLLTDRLLDSQFFLAIQVSYPDPSDVQRARESGVRPGGRIMIHGQPNELKHSPAFYEINDWTNGCIAVSNAAMIDIWQLTTENTPVTIEP
jgi:murein L,D-transpeptidase YafK